MDATWNQILASLKHAALDLQRAVRQVPASTYQIDGINEIKGEVRLLAEEAADIYARAEALKGRVELYEKVTQ